ncbi:MAG: DedA family protein [Beijerinckiaceae bacterium]|jgi:membrane protein YqaA with SNARE-associated domain|nr:DedA family protein [Beijerinckiaceae bacterium]
MTADLAAYAGLFASAFLAASLFPAQSEVVLGGLILAKMQPAWLLIAVASLGNILGSVLNWLLGRGIERYRDKQWFPVSEASLSRAQQFYGRWGRWSLLLSWMPVVGDPLTLVAGVMREPLPSFLVLVAAAKIGRYIVLAALLEHWS